MALRYPSRESYLGVAESISKRGWFWGYFTNVSFRAVLGWFLETVFDLETVASKNISKTSWGRFLDLEAMSLQNFNKNGGPWFQGPNTGNNSKGGQIIKNKVVITMF